MPTVRSVNFETIPSTFWFRRNIGCVGVSEIFSDKFENILSVIRLRRSIGHVGVRDIFTLPFWSEGDELQDYFLKLSLT